MIYLMKHYFLYFQDSVSCQETVANDISNFYGDKSNEAEVQRFCSIHYNISSHIIESFVSVEGRKWWVGCKRIMPA